MNIEVFTDGACSGNPGKGGWAAIIVKSAKYKVQSFDANGGDVIGNGGNMKGMDNIELKGGEEKTTNNRMELTAAMKALEYIKNMEGYENIDEIVINTDSKYLINGITSWINNWKQNGWRTKDKKDVLNKDLWQSLDTLRQGMNVKWKYVQGHVGVKENERCDELAKSYYLS